MSEFDTINNKQKQSGVVNSADNELKIIFIHDRINMNLLASTVADNTSFVIIARPLGLLFKSDAPPLLLCFLI